ncbi:MAG: amidohydrolase family protein, partial [Acidobacteriaceae bacterium]|nr:amidohydrolase family protein [Acidobacteriaceae bacterium]
AHFLPATYLFQGVNSIAITHAPITSNWQSVMALLVTLVVGCFVALKLFRWEKEEKISGRSKLWILAVLAPFFILGAREAITKQGLENEKILARETRRNRSILFQNVRIFSGDGTVISNGAVLIGNGKIVQVFPHPPVNTKSLNAEVREEQGRTLLPGLIDMHVHIGAPGGFYNDTSKYADPNLQARRLAAYLYCGITAVRSTGDWLDQSLKLRQRVNSGAYLGAEFYAYGPLFTAPGGHPTEILGSLPQAIRSMGEQQFIRLPKSPEEARQQVDALKAAGVDGIKAVLEAGSPQWQLFNRLDTRIYDAVIAEAIKDRLPTATHTGSAADVADAVNAGTNSVEHGSLKDKIPDQLFARMKQKGIAYDPTLSVAEAVVASRTGSMESLDDSLLQRAAPADLISDTRSWLQKQKAQNPNDYKTFLTLVRQNLLNAYRSGVLLIVGSDAGNTLVIHGPTVQREMELWVNAGIPPAVALTAATFNAAKVLRAEKRLGLIKEGYDATLVLVDGDPIQDISATERISDVFLKGEEVPRWDLFNQDKK